MDIPRKGAARSRLIRRIIYGAIVLAAIPLITVGLNRLKPAAPEVERATVWIDQVKRGPMVRQVRGLGTLVPEEIVQIPAITDGKIDKILLRPGVNVQPNTVIIEMSNPDLALAANTLEWQVKQAEATYADLKVRLEQGLLTQQSSTATVQSDFTKAKLQADKDKKLFEEKIGPELTYRLSQATADDLANRFEIEKKRLAIQSDSIKAQLDAQRVQIESYKAQLKLKQEQIDQLKVRAGVAGMLQSLGSSANAATGNQVQLEAGQKVLAGTLLAKVAQPWKLKAELKIAETQAKDILIGQRAEIDTRNGVIAGRVSRIDPAVVNGTRTVDVKLEGDLPPGAVPDLSVDGTVELERLTDVLFVGRPVFGQPNAKITIFKLEADNKEASRVPVQLGRSSVNTIEIVEGLKIGDQVILSDMTAWDAHSRIRLK